MVAVGYSTTVLDSYQQSELVGIFGDSKIIFKWGMAEFGKLYRQGYKQCTTCQFMVRTDEVRCPICKRVMRYSTKRGSLIK